MKQVMKLFKYTNVFLAAAVIVTGFCCGCKKEKKKIAAVSVAKKKIITNPNHLVLESAHPSPLSAYNGFFGNNHFKKANEFLKSKGRPEIDWQIR